jgi:hypothetical protein
MGIDNGGEEDDASAWSTWGIPGMARAELGWHLEEKVGWNESQVVDEIDDVVIYQSEKTFPSLGFIREEYLKVARYQENLSVMRKYQLVNKCREMGLNVSGKKVELIQRIIEAKPNINGVIYVDKKKRLSQKKWKPTGQILLVHDDTEEVEQAGGGKLRYGRADIAFIRDLAVAKLGRGYLKNPGFKEPLVCYDIRQLPALLKEYRYDLVVISSHGGEDGLSGKGRSLSKDNLIGALKEGKGVGYLFISACKQANTWNRYYEKEISEDCWDEWWDEADFSTAIIKECPVRCLTVSGLDVVDSPESSLFIINMLMDIMQGSTFSKTLSNVMNKHPKKYSDISLFFTHAGDATFQISAD